MENPIKMDDFGVPLFLETPISKFPGFLPPPGSGRDEDGVRTSRTCSGGRHSEGQTTPPEVFAVLEVGKKHYTPEI